MIKNIEITTLEKSWLDSFRGIEEIVKFFDKIRNKTENITIKHYHVLFGMNKTIIASRGGYDLVKPNKLIILIGGIVYKNVINTCKKCNNIPILWRTFSLKIANNRDYIIFVIDH